MGVSVITDVRGRRPMDCRRDTSCSDFIRELLAKDRCGGSGKDTGGGGNRSRWLVALTTRGREVVWREEEREVAWREEEREVITAGELVAVLTPVS